MKYILQAFIILSLMLSCQSKELKIDFKTVDIDIPGTMGPTLKHHSKYYCYFETDSDEFDTAPIADFYILDETGKIKSKVPVPAIQFKDYDLYVKNDMIFTTEYTHDKTFYLDEKNTRWMETRKTNDMIYEDKDYAVFSRNLGICCCRTLFKDKKTGQQYDVDADNPVVNRLNNVYYLTTKNSVLKITDPKKLKSTGGRPYNDDSSPSSNGTEIEYFNEFSNMFNFSLPTSFIVNNQLFHLYSEDGSMRIAALKNKEFVDIQTFTADIYPYRNRYDTRNFISQNQHQSIQFSTKNPQFFGIIDIVKNTFNVITFKNKYREPILGVPKTMAWVEESFDYYYSHFNTLTVDQIDHIEQKGKATNLTPKYNTCEMCTEKQFFYKKIERK